MYLDYAFPTVTAIATLLLFWFSGNRRSVISRIALFVALLCILVPVVVSVYKIEDKTNEVNIGKNIESIGDIYKKIGDMKIEYNSKIDNLNSEIANIKNDYNLKIEKLNTELKNRVTNSESKE